MSVRHRSLIAVALISLVSGCSRRPAPEAPTASPPPIESPADALATGCASSEAPDESRQLVIANSQIIELSSKETGRDYELIVGVPDSYEKEPQRTYPVLYLLDGQWDFALVNALTGGLRFDEVVPEFFVVGISYGGDGPDYGKLRGEDYAPTRAHPAHAKQAYGGDGPLFLEFLEHAVLPTIEGRYRIDSSRRMLSGASLGGLFSLYALFERPALFQTILALSPAVGWDDGYLFARERAFRRAHPSLNKRVWLSVGSEEWPEFQRSARQFFDQFQASAYADLTSRVRIVEGEKHAGNKPEAYNRALRFAFEPRE